MTERTIFTDRKLKFESAHGTVTLTVNMEGLTLDMFQSDGTDVGHAVAAGMPLDFAREVRDFLDYALSGEPMGVMTDEDGRPERRVAERRVAETTS